MSQIPTNQDEKSSEEKTRQIVAQAQAQSAVLHVQSSSPNVPTLTTITPLQIAEAELRKERAAVRSLQAQRDELLDTIEQLQTHPFKLCDIDETSQEYKRYNRTVKNQVRNSKTTTVQRAKTLGGFRAKRDGLLIQFEKDRVAILGLTQQIAILERQAVADDLADAERKRAAEEADRLAQAIEEFEEANNVVSRRASITRGRKRARAFSLGEVNVNDGNEEGANEEENDDEMPVLDDPVEQKRQPVNLYSSLSQVELLWIARTRGIVVPDNVPAAIICGLLEAVPASPTNEITSGISSMRASEVPPVQQPQPVPPVQQPQPVPPAEQPQPVPPVQQPVMTVQERRRLRRNPNRMEE